MLTTEFGKYCDDALQSVDWWYWQGTSVHEIDALGGQMGICADMSVLQSKMLNKSKGPQYSLRMQQDKLLYQRNMKHFLETQENCI